MMGSLDRRPAGAAMLRVKHGPYCIAGCRTIDEVVQHVDLVELVPEPRLPVRRGFEPGA
jgi:hypothetical protein